MMNYKDFLYRQRQRIRYHTTRNATKKRIAEINQYHQRVEITSEGYHFTDIELNLPKSGYSFVFQPKTFDLFISNAQNLNGRYFLKDGRLLFAFEKYTVQITSPSEPFVINEIFVEKCYNFRLPNNELVIVVDIGMNVGLASLFFSNHPNVSKVFSFEPFRPTFENALINFDLNRHLSQNITPHNIGLGDHDENITTSYSRTNSGINSSVRMQSDFSSESDIKETIEIKNAREVLNSILSETEGHRLILKIDTEGSEYAIFDSLFKSRVSNRIIGFLVEWHFQGPERLEKKLLDEGFSLTSFVLGKNSGLIYAFR